MWLFTEKHNLVLWNQTCCFFHLQQCFPWTVFLLLWRGLWNSVWIMWWHTFLIKLVVRELDSIKKSTCLETLICEFVFSVRIYIFFFSPQHSGFSFTPPLPILSGCLQKYVISPAAMPWVFIFCLPWVLLSVFVWPTCTDSNSSINNCEVMFKLASSYLKWELSTK